MITMTNLKKNFRTEEAKTLATPSPSQGGESNVGIYELNSLNNLKK